MSSNKIKAEYDRIAPFFSMGSALTFPFRRSLYEQSVIPRLHLCPGAAALELCCGAGHNFPYILDAIGPEGTLIGIDFSEKMLAKAQKRVDRNGWKNVRLIYGDATRIDEIIDQHLDLILCSLALSLIPARISVLRAIRNTLK